MSRDFKSLLAATLLLAGTANPARAYVVNQQIANTSDPRNAGVSACPMPTRMDREAPGGIDRRWDTTLGPNIFTTPGFAGGAQAEVQGVILDSFAAWTGVAGTGLTSASYAPLATTSGGSSCTSADGLNTICFAQDDSFATGVLAYTRVVTADVVGEALGPKTASFVGEILDADVELNPAIPFATPGALAANPAAYDLESILVHELGHTLGFAESPVASAAMFPFAPAPGTIRGARPTPAAPDAPLADDDRAGLRVVYPGATAFGTIRGRILPVNPLSLAAFPATAPGLAVTGYYGAHVVAVDAGTGQVMAGTLGGWSCDSVQQVTNFDGSYEIGGLPLGRSYEVYVEPLTGPVAPGMLSGPLVAQPCRPGSSNACTPPVVNMLFSARVKP
ncbi:MAG TPA: matrixin family metalloprotease [Candidatus Acidoferrales bacterium]|nr:matrixin family metalloprotease [Candidatus Acidoferrales bacterium]